MTPLKVLVVDDEWNMRNLLRIYLIKEGFEVQEATTGTEALALLRKNAFDIILLDIMMPDMDGWQVCRKIRETNNTPILMLTARTDTKDKVQGLGLGADDYVTKPFEPDELLARIHAIVRRYKGAQAVEPMEEKLEFPGMRIHPQRREVLVWQQPLDFTQKEFDLLLCMAEKPQRAFTRDQLVERVWGQDYPGESRVVDTHIKNIREKVQKAGLSYNPIQTVWGVGYKFQVPGDAV